MADTPPDKEALLGLWRKVTPEHFWGPMEGTPSEAVFRSQAGTMATLAESLDRGTQGRYFLPYATQRDLPASYGLRAVGTATLTRVGHMDRWVSAPGSMIQLDGYGRTYASTGPQTWWPQDTRDRAVQVACAVEGFVGNLTFAAEADGTISLTQVGLADQAHDHVGTGASLVDLTGPVGLQDTGVPDTLAPEDVGLYVEITASATASNVGQVRQIVGWAGSDTEIPVGSGLYPRTVVLESSTWQSATEVLLFDSTAVAYTDYTSESLSPGVPDIPVFGATPAPGDALYFGASAPLAGLVLDLGVAGDGSWTVAWEYWDGGTWVAYTDLVDLSLAWVGNLGTVRVDWTVPATQVATASPVSGQVLYFSRARLDTLASVVVIPTLTRLVTRILAPLVLDPGGVSWRLLSWQDMGLTLTSVQAPAGGRDNDLWLLGDERGVYPQPGEAQETFRARVSALADVVSPNAINRAVNRALAPLGLQGRAVDVGSTNPDGTLAFPGLWLDLPPSSLPMVSALDLYGPGDLYPESPWYLPLGADEAYGWFLVLVPWDGTGEFGAFFDTTALTDYGTAAAVDSAFFDGYPVTYYGAIASLWSTLDVVKAGGVGFTMIRTEDP